METSPRGKIGYDAANNPIMKKKPMLRKPTPEKSYDTSVFCLPCLFCVVVCVYVCVHVDTCVVPVSHLSCVLSWL